MKFAVFFALLTVAFSVSVRKATGTTSSPTSSQEPTAIEKPDILVQLAGGASTTASGDQAVGSAADKDSGAAGAKGSDNAAGIAGSGFALGFGQGNGPDATPGLGGLLNIFN